MADHLNSLVPTRTIPTPYGPCHELTVQDFFDHVLPSLKSGINPAQVVAALKNTGTPSFNKTITQHGRWKGFAKDPLDCPHSLHQTFRHLEGVVKMIVKATGLLSNCSKPNLHFESNPTPNESWFRSDDTFPDASFWEGTERTWKNVAVCAAYKKGNLVDDVEANIAKIMHSMATCMAQDPRRRFVIGYTIENVKMRLWLCNRRDVLVSRRFNFITNHLRVVHFFLSVLHANPHQLGWDTSMRRLPDENFDIDIVSDGQIRTYRTQDMLIDKAPLGKGTRVWKAVRVEDGKETGPVVVLKDCWVSPMILREGENIRRIREAIIAHDGQSAARLLLDVEWDGDVLVNGDEATPDYTLPLQREAVVRDPVAIDQQSVQPDISKMAASNRLIHYRIVIAPVGKRPVSHETFLPIIYRALSNAACALQSMHKAGWVHRDVSTGNILTTDEQALLADFEFAKQAADEDNLNIGTMEFKAFEIETQTYNYQPEPDTSAVEREKVPTREERIEAVLRRQGEAKSSSSSRSPLRTPAPAPAPPPLPPPPKLDPRIGIPVRYNPLHDLESLWWVALYFLLKREVYAPGEPEDEDEAEWDREEQRAWAEGVFYGESGRCQIMLIPDNFFYRGLRIVHPRMHSVVAILDGLRGSLVNYYTKVEKNARSIAWTCAEGLYKYFIEGFAEIARRPELQNVHLRPMLYPFSPSPTPQIVSAERERVGERNIEESQVAKDTQAEKGDVQQLGKRRRETTATEAPIHRYNLRPRLNRG